MRKEAKMRTIATQVMEMDKSMAEYEGLARINFEKSLADLDAVGLEIQDE